MFLKNIIAGAGSIFTGGFAWKIGAFVGLAGVVVLTGFLIAEKADNSRLGKRVTALTFEINDPATGYAARLAQSHTNTAQLQTALETQNAAVAAQSAADQKALVAARRRLAEARGEIERLRNAAAVTLSYVPQGATACERTQDVINRYVGGRE